MKKHKVDINNLPTEEVLAINDTDDMMTGQIVVQGIGVYCVKDKNVLPVVTHYITKEELLNLEEE